MTIAVLNPIIIPAIAYDRIFLLRLEISQLMVVSDMTTPKYTVTIEYRKFGVVDGVMHYAPGNSEIVIVDYLAMAMQKAETGDLDMVQALAAIEKALAQIIADHDGLQTAIV